MSILTDDELHYFIDNCLDFDTTTINYNGQINLNDEHLEKMSKCSNATYDGIRFLWQSLTFGSSRKDSPVYESYYNKAVSIIKLEIKSTLALVQKYPSPLKDKFIIHYPHGNKKTGFKKIVLLNRFHTFRYKIYYQRISF